MLFASSFCVYRTKELPLLPLEYPSGSVTVSDMEVVSECHPIQYSPSCLLRFDRKGVYKPHRGL